MSGDEKAQRQLNDVSVGEYNAGQIGDDPISVSLTFRSSGASLLLSARGLTLDTPATGDSASAVLGWEGSNYFANDGQCTIILATLDYTVLEPLPALQVGVPRGEPIPIYSGTFECVDVEEVRGGSHVTLEGVFQFEPEE